MCRAAMGQYLLAVATLASAVVVNLWGKESEALNSLFATVIAAAVWGGMQRQRGSNEIRDDKKPAE